MATYLSTKFQTGSVPAHTGGPVSACVTASFSLSAALAVNDVIKMVKIPNGATVTRVYLVSDDLDTNGVPTITLSVGDSASATRFINANAVAKTGGSAEMDAGVHPQAYTAEDYLAVTVSAGPATGATTGKVSLTAFYVTP